MAITWLGVSRRELEATGMIMGENGSGHGGAEFRGLEGEGTLSQSECLVKRPEAEDIKGGM